LRVLLIGGTGNISSYVTALAAQRGMDVYILTRGKSDQSLPKGVKTIISDITDVTGTKEKLQGLSFDVVADFITYTPQRLGANLEIFRDKCQQYIFVSSTSVYNPSGENLAEDAPLTNLAWDYPRDKIGCEALLQMDARIYGTNYTIVRPGETNGDLRIPGVFVPHPQYWSFIDRMERGQKIIVNDDGSAVRQFTHSADFAKGFVGLFMNEGAFGEIFNITSDEVLSWLEVTEIVAEAAGVEPKIAFLPSMDIVRTLPRLSYASGDHGAATFGTLLCSKAHSKTVDNTKIKNLVPDFQCTISFRETMARTMEFYRRHPKYKEINDAWNRDMDYLLEHLDKS
jgi:nucleoside-diphosphate-sugar epimerase